MSDDALAACRSNAALQSCPRYSRAFAVSHMENGTAIGASLFENSRGRNGPVGLGALSLRENG
jgi:hypothetical protein